MSAVFSLEQVLAGTESATSEYSTTSQCLSALLGRPGRVKFITVNRGLCSQFVFSLFDGVGISFFSEEGVH